jgi:hypothetical protein
VKHSSQIGKPRVVAHQFLREQSPIVVAHLTEGCSTCAAGLEVFQRNDTPDASRQAVLELFERELFNTLQASGNAALTPPAWYIVPPVEQESRESVQ